MLWRWITHPRAVDSYEEVIRGRPPDLPDSLQVFLGGRGGRVDTSLGGGGVDRGVAALGELEQGTGAGGREYEAEDEPASALRPTTPAGAVLALWVLNLEWYVGGWGYEEVAGMEGYKDMVKVEWRATALPQLSRRGGTKL